MDICFPKQQIAIFLDGCFWHGCEQHRSTPKNNQAWWIKKIQDNRNRDTNTSAHLANAGWIVLRFWEHETVDAVVERIKNEVTSRRRIKTG